MFRLNPFIRAGLSASVVSLAFPALADVNEETLVVTASATEQSVKDAPASISVITQQDLQRKPVQNLKDVLRDVPGVQLTNEGDNRKGVSIRGLSSSYTLILVDGKRVNSRNAVFRHNDFDLNWIPVDAIERIEVVRGPASVLYGRSSPGGIVALNSRKRSFDPGGEIKVFAGNNNQRGAAFDVTGALDDNDRVAARLSGMTRYADSQFDPLKEERYALMPSLTWRITDQTRLDLMAYLHRDPEGGSHSGLPYDGTVVPHYGQKISNTFYEGEDDYDKYDRRENMVGYNIEHMFDSGWSVRQKLRYLHTDVELNQVYAAGWLNETELNRGYSGSDEKMSAITLDNQLDGSFDTWQVNHRLLVGIDYQDRSNNTTGYYGAFPAIDAFNPVYGADPDYITQYSSEKVAKPARNSARLATSSTSPAPFPCRSPRCSPPYGPARTRPNARWRGCRRDRCGARPGDSGAFPGCVSPLPVAPPLH